MDTPLFSQLESWAERYMSRKHTTIISDIAIRQNIEIYIYIQKDTCTCFYFMQIFFFPEVCIQHLGWNYIFIYIYGGQRNDLKYDAYLFIHLTVELAEFVSFGCIRMRTLMIRTIWCPQDDFTAATLLLIVNYLTSICVLYGHMWIARACAYTNIHKH